MKRTSKPVESHIFAGMETAVEEQAQAAAVYSGEELTKMKTAAQKYSESNAEAILAYFRGVDGTFVPTPAHPSPRYPMVDDTVGIHTVRLSQSTLAGYLEQAFVAGERAEFGRLDKLIIESKLVPCPYCSEGDPGQCDACHNTCRVMLSQQHEYSLHIRPVPKRSSRRVEEEHND